MRSTRSTGLAFCYDGKSTTPKGATLKNMPNDMYPLVFTILMFTVFTVNSAVLEFVVAYIKLAFPTGHIIIRLHTQIPDMMSVSSALMMMIVTNKIFGVALGIKIGAT
jgi:hypothetical protein